MPGSAEERNEEWEIDGSCDLNESKWKATTAGCQRMCIDRSRCSQCGVAAGLGSSIEGSGVGSFSSRDDKLIAHRHGQADLDAAEDDEEKERQDERELDERLSPPCVHSRWPSLGRLTRV